LQQPNMLLQLQMLQLQMLYRSRLHNNFQLLL
jgi:hypothetical protein